MAIRVLDEDLVRVRGDRFDSFTGETKTNRVIRMLYWGDDVDLVDPAENDDATVRNIRVTVYNPATGLDQEGTIRKKRDRGENLPFRFRSGPTPHLTEVVFVDVQQGDATLIRTPERRTLLVDGGEGVFTARLLAAAFPRTTAADPFVVDYLVVSHGDADHFSGLVALADAAQDTRPNKQIHTRVLRYFHNGLVKRSEKVVENGITRRLKDRERFGDFVQGADDPFVTSLFEDPRQAPAMNTRFAKWSTALDQLMATPASAAGAPAAPGESLPVVRRVALGDDAAFASLGQEGIQVEVLGPVVEEVAGNPALRVLRDHDRGQSASHTINGHSVILRLQHDRVRFLLGGDLNISGSELLLQALANANPPRSLTSEVLKVPHHGSHEFDPAFLAAVAPVVSVVSSGDENAAKEFVHPRANLMAALGRASRGPEPLVFSTELAAFFAFRNRIQPELHEINEAGELVDRPVGEKRRAFFAFQRLRFGAVRVRTDGQRVLVAVESASDNVKEAYAFRVAADGSISTDSVQVL